MTGGPDPVRGPVPAGLDHDVVVVGSGFGGSVAALRLAEKGYDVLVYEAGRRFADGEHARTSWDLPRYLWAPRLGWFGIQRLHRLPDVVVLAGAGVGGGSLNYANTLYRPPPAFYAHGPWAGLADWEAELAPHYDTAERMLGVIRSTFHGPVEEAMRRTAEDLGVGSTFMHVPVGVFLPTPTVRAGETVEDPYFGGRGPARTACDGCGNCMVGCRRGAKNTLVKNYLHLAEAAGARVEPLRTVTRVEPLDPSRPGAGWRVTTQRTGSPGVPGLRRVVRTVTCRDVVLAAGAWGTQSLLHRMRAEGVLPDLPPALGTLTRTNSEALVGVTTDTVPAGADLTRGLAITSSFHPAPDTHVENVRYGRGSDAMGLLGTLLVDGGGRWPRPLRFVGPGGPAPGRPGPQLPVRSGAGARSSAWSCRPGTARSPRRGAGGGCCRAGSPPPRGRARRARRGSRWPTPRSAPSPAGSRRPRGPGPGRAARWPTCSTSP